MKKKKKLNQLNYPITCRLDNNDKYTNGDRDEGKSEKKYIMEVFGIFALV